MSFRVVPFQYRGPGRLSAGALALTLLLALLGGSRSPAHAAATSVSVVPFGSPAVVGTPVLINAIVTCAGGSDPTGSVAFADGTTGMALGTDPAGSAGPGTGQRVFVRGASFGTIGDHAIIATYASTNPACDSASGSAIVTVTRGPTVTQVTASPNPTTVDQSVLLSATVTCTRGSIAGGVTFVDTTTGATLGTAPFTHFGVPRFAGVAELSTSFVTPGAHTITAAFGGSSDLCGPSSGSTTVTVTPSPPTACIPRPRVVTQAVRNGDGHLRVTVMASTNQGFSNDLRALAWTRLDNATVEVVGVGDAIPGQRTGLPAGTQSATLLVGRVTPGRASTVRLIVTDACGEWATFFGGGPGAF